MSAYASLSDGPPTGRLTQDVDPPGLESLASFTASAVTTKRGDNPTEVSPAKKLGATATKTQQSPTSAREVSRVEASRHTNIATSKVSLQNAKRSLTAARATVQILEAQRKKADEAAKQAETPLREAEKQSRQVQERLE